MLKLVGKWLKVYEDEIGLFLWVAALLFIVRSCGMVLNNYAETAFLKRFGVEYLPIVNMLNAIVTFVVMGAIAGMMSRIQSAPFLTYLFMFCGLTMAGMRLVIPLGIDLVYPVLLMLKSQFEVLQALIFWNMANDLFNMRQSKRLFPLITAGGVLGLILSSFGTPLMVKVFSFDNLLYAYLGLCVAGALAVKGMSSRYPTLLLGDKKTRKAKKKTPMIEEFKKIVPLMKESILIKIMILLTLLPNVVVPIMNYQFNYAVNAQFASETGLIQFFSYFRGFLNIISLIILLFVGRIYGKWGLPVALMFHPFNYMLAFMAFLLRFDVFSAMYARMSTNILRTTINIPANAILMGLFPVEYRGIVRPFLRGTVVRLGLFLGSGLILASGAFFHPRYLSLVALPFVIGWITAPFILKRRYSKILLDLVSRNMIDLKSMGEEDVGQLFRDKKIQTQLSDAFLKSQGDNCVWYANLLKSLALKDLDSQILTKLKQEDDQTCIKLLELLSPEADKQAIPVLRDLVDPAKPELMLHIIRASNRLAPKLASDFDYGIFENDPDPEVRAHAIIGLFRQSPEKYRSIIDAWLDSENEIERKAAVIAAGATAEASFVSRLNRIIEDKESESLLPLALKSLHSLNAPQLNEAVSPYLSHSKESIRAAALEVFEIVDDETLKQIIPLMGDLSEEISASTKNKIDQAPYNNGQILVESLSIPKRAVRESIFDLLESLDIKDLDVYRFARAQVESGYQDLTEAEGLKLLPQGPARDLLSDHLNQSAAARMENTMRVLAAQDHSGQMRIIYRGLFSSDKRQQANSQEALEDQMDPSLSRIMLPLLGGVPDSERLAIGKKNFKLPHPGSDSASVLSHFLAKEDWVTVMLAAYIMAQEKLGCADPKALLQLTESENSHVSQMAQTVLKQTQDDPHTKEHEMDTEITISDKILRLKGIELFEGLSVGEFAAVASVTEEIVYPAGEFVIKEGDTGETMYMIVSGEVSVVKGLGEDQEIELARIGTGDYFGEMALVDDVVRSASVRTEKESRLLVLHKQEFKEIVREYPQIALQICKVLSASIRNLHEKVKT